MQRKDVCMIAHCIRNLAHAQQAGFSRSDTQLNGVHAEQNFCGASFTVLHTTHSLSQERLSQSVAVIDSLALRHSPFFILVVSERQKKNAAEAPTPALIPQVDRRAVKPTGQFTRSAFTNTGLTLHFAVGTLKSCIFRMFVCTKSAEHASALQPLADRAVPAANSCRTAVSSLNTEDDS